MEIPQNQNTTEKELNKIITADMKASYSKRDIKKFLIRLIIFFLVLSIPSYIYIEYFKMYFEVEDYPMYKHSKDFVQSKDKSKAMNPDLLIMGDSRALCGILPDKISDNAYSLCYKGGSSVEIYYVIENYLKNHTPPKTIFCSISPYHLEEHQEFFYRTVNYGFITNLQMLEVLNKTVELNDNPFIWRKPLANNYYLELLMYRLNFILFYKAELANGGYYKRKNANESIYNSMKKSSGYLNFSPGVSTQNLNVESRTPVFKPSPVLTYYLERIFDICNKNSIKVIYQAMPMSETSRSSLKKEYLDGYEKYLDKIAQKYPSAVISSEIIKLPNDNFGDSSHLNGKGAEKTTTYFKEKYFPNGVE